MKVILISRVLKNNPGCHFCEAHFKGFVFGKKVSGIYLYGHLAELKVCEAYLLLLKDVKIVGTKLEGKVERQKALTKVLI